MRPVPVVLRLFAFMPQLYDRIFAEGYPHDAHAAQTGEQPRPEGGRGRTFVLAVEGAVAAPSAEGVRLCVPLTVGCGVRECTENARCTHPNEDVPYGRRVKRPSACLRPNPVSNKRTFCLESKAGE